VCALLSGPAQQMIESCVRCLAGLLERKGWGVCLCICVCLCVCVGWVGGEGGGCDIGHRQ